MASSNIHGVVSLDLVDAIVLDALVNAPCLPASAEDVLSVAESDARMTPDLRPRGILGPWTGPVLRGLEDVGYVRRTGSVLVIPLRDSQHRKVTLSAQTHQDGHCVYQRLADVTYWFTPMDNPVSEVCRLARWAGLYSKYDHEVREMPFIPGLMRQLEQYVTDNVERLVSGVTLLNRIPPALDAGCGSMALRRRCRAVDDLCHALNERYLELLQTSPGSQVDRGASEG